MGNALKIEYPDTLRLLQPAECEAVAGGARSTMDYAVEGFNTGGALGTVAGAAVTGATIGATRWGVLGAAAGFSFGFGWGVGTSLRRFVYRR